MNGGALNYRRLTLKQSWLSHYFFNPRSETFGNIAGSARKAGYRGNSRTVAVTGFQTLRSPNMLPEVRRRMKTVLSSEETLQEITGIAQQEVSDYKPSDKLKALELLAKFHKLLTDKVETTDTSDQSAFIISQVEAGIRRIAKKDNISQQNAAISFFDRANEDGEEPSVLQNPSNYGQFQSAVESHLAEKAAKPEQITDLGDESQ